MPAEKHTKLALTDLSAEKLTGILTQNQQVHPSWERLNNTISELGISGLNSRNRKVQTLLKNDGANYNPHLKQEPDHFIGELDCLPHIIDIEQWQQLEAGLLERAELFNFILKDIYSEKKLIFQDIVPSALLFSQSQFLRNCHQLQEIQKTGLFFHHCTLILDENGQYFVMQDKTQQPTNLGLTLENRTVLTRTFPSLFRESQVHRLAGFFQRLRQQLLQLVDTHEQHRIVLLTSGATVGVEFELAHLANYMGLPLVQSSDLIVRNGYLWLKTIEGLKQIDVLYRFIDDVFLDPVELRADSAMGIAGLLEVARLGRVKIINPIGVGFLESLLLHKYLDKLCEFYIGRSPRLKSIPTYWCYDANDREYIIDNLDKLQLIQSQQGIFNQTIDTKNLDQNERNQLIRSIHFKPEKFIAREWIRSAQTPCFNQHEFKSSEYRLNCFSIAHKHSFLTMPGSFTEVVKPGDAIQAAFFHHTMAKDTWIMASEVTETQQALPPVDTIEQSHWQLVTLPSRVVENLFWFGRYAERADASIRIMRTLLILMGSEEALSNSLRKQLLTCLFTVTEGVDISELLDQPENNYHTQLLQTLNDSQRVGSIRSTLNSLLMTTDRIKELLSLDTIKTTNRIQDELNQLQLQIDQPGFIIEDLSLDNLMLPLIALNGITHEGMHNIGWRFIELGKRIERTQQTATFIKVLWAKVTPLNEQAQLIRSLLMTLELLITYRRRYRTLNDLSSAFDLMVLDATNPRSIIYQLVALQAHLESLPQQSKKTREMPTELRLITEAYTKIKTLTIAEMGQIQNNERQNLSQLLTELQNQMNLLGNVISDKFFDHSLYPQQLIKNNWEE